MDFHNASEAIIPKFETNVCLKGRYGQIVYHCNKPLYIGWLQSP